MNCLVGDGVYSAGYYVEGLCQRGPSKLRRVFSAGQPGAPTAALNIARRFGLRTGGWAPHGWLRPNPETGADERAAWLADGGLVQHPDGGTAFERYRSAAYANADDSDGAVLLRSDGSVIDVIATDWEAQRLNRPIERVTIDRRDGAWRADRTPLQVADWIVATEIGVLTMAGEGRAEGAEAFVEGYLVEAMRCLGLGERE